MSGWLAQAEMFWLSLPDELRLVVVSVLKIVVVLVPLILAVAYFTYWERKIIGWMQNRVGPNRVGWKGLLQPFADVIKMLLKEIVVPTNSNKFLFLIAPILSLVPAFVVWAAIPFSEPTSDERAQRGVSVLLRFADPWGHVHEVFSGARHDFDTQFASPAGVSGFVTEHGMGHLLLAVPDCNSAEEFYTRALGLRVTDRMDMGGGHRAVQVNMVGVAIDTVGPEGEHGRRPNGSDLDDQLGHQ